MCEVLYSTAFKILVTSGSACVVSFWLFYADFSRCLLNFKCEVYFREIVSDVTSFFFFIFFGVLTNDTRVYTFAGMLPEWQMP